MKNILFQYTRFFSTMSILFLLHSYALSQSNFWVQLESMKGGDVKSFTFNKNNYFFAAVKTKGIYKSIDNGTTWQSTGLQNISISSIYINTSLETLYAGTETEGLYYSKDYGESWQLILPELVGYKINCLEFDGFGKLLIGTDKGLFTCDNDGKNLTQITNGLSSDNFRSVKLLTTGDIVVAGSTGIYRSIVANTFQPLHNGIVNKNIYSLFTNSSGDLYAGGTSGIYKLKFDYSTWIKLDTNSILQNVRYIFVANNSKIYAGDTNAIYVSTDTGKVFVKSFSDSTNINQIENDKYNSLYAATEKGFYSITSNSWKKTGVSQNIFINQIISDKSGNIYSASSEGLFKCNNEGSSWEYLTSSLDILPVTAVTKDTLGFIFIGTASGVYRSTNEGKNWAKVNAGLLNFNINALLSIGNIQICGTKNGLFRSTDNGSSWKQIISIPANASVNCLLKSEQNIIFAGASTGVYMSTDYGFSWQIKDNGLAITEIYHLDLNESGLLIAANYSSIFKSEDKGANWSAIVTNFSSGYIRNVALNPIGEIYLGTNSGIFRSVNNGTNWIQLNSGLTNIDIRALKITKNGYLFAGTNGNGIFRSSPLSPIVPKLISPTNKATNLAKSLTLSWSESTGSLLYRVQVSTQQDFSTIFYEDIATTTSVSLKGLQDVTTYYWKVNASNGVGESAWSEIWSFTTLKSPPPVPTQIYPLSNEVVSSINPILKWNANDRTDFYEIQVSEDINFSSTAFYFIYVYSTQQIAEDLKENTYYYWRIRANNSGGFSNWSTGIKFKTPTKIPYQPTLISPNNSSTININFDKPELALRWNKVINAESYMLSVATDQNFSNIIINQGLIKDTTFTITSLKSEKYFWRVKAFNKYSEGPWSAIFNFSATLTDIEEINGINDYKLSQNYPNPFNPETNISFSIPVSDNVKIYIFDIYGRIVKTLIDGFYKQGTYNIKYKPENISSGLYYYQLITSSFIETKKMLFLR